MSKWRYTIPGFLAVEKSIILCLVFSFVFSPLSTFFTFQDIKIAEAAQVTIDADADLNATAHLHAGPQTVFIDDQTGYKFYRSGVQTGVAAGECVYSKTTDGGATWGTPVLIDDQGTGVDCLGISIWYDRWTPGDTTGNIIHVATFEDGSSDDVYYNNIDTASSDNRLGSATAINASSNLAATNTAALGANTVAITKGTDGTVYITTDDANGTGGFVTECSTTCQTTTNWTRTGGLPRPQDVANDFSMLVPMIGGDIMLINRDVSADDIRSRIWRNGAGAWDTAWTIIDNNAPENATYDVGMAVTVSSSTVAATSSIYLAYIAQNATPGTDDDIRTAVFNGTIKGWDATTADVLTNNVKGLTNVSIGRDTNNGTIYVAYTAQATANVVLTGNVYWKSSSDGMANWGSESAAINSSADDMYGMDLNIMSNQRLYASWVDISQDEVYGETIADLVPGVIVSGNGTQTATTTAAFTNTHVGGSFVIAEQANSRDVTNITITETGTIDGSTDVENIKLFYESDTTAPYNCASVSYGGSESQFGSTDTNGFSGANGTAAFSGSSITVSTSSAMCVYVVLDVNENADGGQYLNVQIANPSTDVTVTNSGEVIPTTAVEIGGGTGIDNDNVTQIHYHWREDNGTEGSATSKTSSVEDTNFTGYQRTPVRLRMEVSNEGNVSSPATQYRLEYSLATTTCSAATLWTDVGASDDDWNMYNTGNLTDGNDTTNVALALNGAVTDENTTFLTPNGAVKDTSSQTGNITLTSTQYTEFEYSIIASTTAQDGNTYCFRTTSSGTPLKTYSVYPAITITADVNVLATTTQTATLNVPSTNQYVGAKFALSDATGAHTINSVTITENGTVDAENGLDNILLRYDLDTSAPYNCASETYVGSETQFGSTDTNGFSGANGTSTFSGSVAVSTTQAMCIYVVVDVTTGASNGQTIELQISNATTDVVLASGGTAPASPQALPGSTTLQGAVLTQSRYHWRNDDGTQATATSQTAGIENTPIDYVSQNTQVRLRMEVSNEGAITSPNTALRLEYGTKVTTCSAVSSWTDVGDSGGAFDMYNSLHLNNGANTTNISTTLGGVTDDNASFKATNAGVKDTSSQVATTTFTSTEFIETEFSIIQTTNAGYNTTYCFRLSNAGSNLNTYSVYPEITSSPERDFEIQRNFVDVTGTSVTITAGTNYIAPASTSTAFIRITNTHHTGAGDITAGGTQNADDVTVYISNPENILNSITFVRPNLAINETRVYWEIVEFIGSPGSDNEIRVRDADAITYATNALSATGTAVTNIVNDADVAVFITGQFNPAANTTSFNAGQSTSNWLSSSDQPTFARGSSATTSRVSYVVVEFLGANWKVQRAQHTYTAAGVTETENITALNSLNRSFLHTQKRSATALTGTDEFGAEVWLSSMGVVSFFLESGATTPSGQTSVAWVIENTQTSAGSMNVYRSDGFVNGGTEPVTHSIEIQTGVTLDDLTNASIFTNSRGAGTGTLYPRPIAGISIASTTHYLLWRSDTGAQLNYRTEVIEWPTAGLNWEQNDYWFFVDNDALIPTDIWPVGAASLGESTSLTGSDEPLGDGEHIRIRMLLTVLNATFPEQTESFKLQYGERTTPSCTAIDEGDWFTVGSTTGSTIWRGYNAPGIIDGTALSIDPPTGGDLKLTFADVAGTYEEQNSSAVNPFTVVEGDNIEYDWHIQQNGVPAETFYCFRMVKNDGTVINYADYPQLRTSSFTAKTQNWRFYSDVNNETPTASMAAENTAPIDIANGSTTKLRITVKETENIARDDVRFRLQYSEYADFSTAYDVHSTTTCIATSTWCYFNGGGSDNAVISTKVLTDVDACAAGVGDGCGTHNEGVHAATGFRHENGAATEYEFALISGLLRANAVYYFRLYDVVQDIPVVTNTSESYPSLTAVGGSLAFDVTGLTSGESTEGVTLDITSTPTAISFGDLPLDTDYEAAYRLNINTNATEGYKVLMYSTQDLINEYGRPIPPIAATNALPASWNDLSNGCLASMPGCFGYHAGDDSLDGSVRFGDNDTYARVSSTTPEEVMFSSVPINDTHDIVYRLRITELQSAGDYTSRIIFLAVPVY